MDAESPEKLKMFCKLLKETYGHFQRIIYMFSSWRQQLSGAKVSTRHKTEAQYLAMCSTYPICSNLANDSSSGRGASNRSDGSVPGIFDLDVGDTNWVITSSFIIFTMQTGETHYLTAANGDCCSALATGRTL